MYCLTELLGLFLVLRYSLSLRLECNSTREDFCMHNKNYCLNAGTCSYDKTICQYRCLCTPLFIGRRCGQTIFSQSATRNISKTHQGTSTSPRNILKAPAGKMNSSSDTSKKALLTKNVWKSSGPSISVHVCSPKYKVRPLKERQCLFGLNCIYGYCNMQNTAVSCTCDAGGRGLRCEKKCCLKCSGHGRCDKYINGTERCNCDTNYDGRLCEQMMIISTPLPDKDIRPLWVSVVVILISLVIGTATMFYCMWRNRVTIIMNIVHYFQAYEDDDEKTYDSFISYKSADVDEDFVLHVLLPKLEELGFSVCLHFRDFLPGEPIANNIINAINNSRRTILILTPRYVSSEFTRLEYQVAQHEMLKRKHKIIPVLLEDISKEQETMDPNLKQILRCVTYLEYPGAESGEKSRKRFWKKLSLAMPKKKQNELKRKQVGDGFIEQNLEAQVIDAIAENAGPEKVEMAHI
ncbi:uncharacterized protein LOC132544826 [Ylistrum balloti]|uniref:uncharacterized protein LOC132544826 n=1 Tax=Ylistrum balloti TaxID=509963 RepID=UPI002905BD14|nr:uncharacterized protein LOC132544826 [Ylistrum balloti]